MAAENTKNICKNGHTFYKSSDCPSCPTCEKITAPASEFLALLSSPARNALLQHGIDTLEKLSVFTEKEILRIHGIGKASLPIFRKSLIEQGLCFKESTRASNAIKNIDEIDTYIKQFPKSIQDILNTIRKTIKDNAPDSVETIAYGIPAYMTNKKPLVYFAAFKNHIGFYATPSGHNEFKDELSKYKQGKGSVQFPLDGPIPYGLIERIVKFRVQENIKLTKK